MKTKQQIIEEIEQIMLDQELQSIEIMDAWAIVLDYVRSSDDRRAEIAEFENDPEIKKLIAENEKEKENGIQCR